MSHDVLKQQIGIQLKLVHMFSNSLECLCFQPIELQRFIDRCDPAQRFMIEALNLPILRNSEIPVATGEDRERASLFVQNLFARSIILLPEQILDS